MNDEEQKRFLQGLEDGMVPAEIIDGKTNGPQLLKQLREKLSFDAFRQVMRRLVMPNRLARPIERLTYIESEEDLEALEARLQMAIEYHREKLNK